MEHDLDGPYCVESSDMTQASGPLRVTPKIDNITPGLGPVDSPVGISIVGSGFGNSPTVTVGGGGITASIQSASATSISVTLNISAEASGGNHAITVTANGQQSNSMDFYDRSRPSCAEIPRVSFETKAAVVRLELLHIRYWIRTAKAIQSTRMGGFRRP